MGVLISDSEETKIIEFSRFEKFLTRKIEFAGLTMLWIKIKGFDRLVRKLSKK